MLIVAKTRHHGLSKGSFCEWLIQTGFVNNRFIAVFDSKEWIVHKSFAASLVKEQETVLHGRTDVIRIWNDMLVSK